MKLVYLLLACALVTMNSAFAMSEEEGPFGENNAFFCLKKETVLKHFDSSQSYDHAGYPYLREPLIIKGHAYNLLGSMKGYTEKDFRAFSSIQWLVFKNDAPSHPKPCEDWHYFLQLYIHHPFKVDAVNLEIHKIVPAQEPIKSAEKLNSDEKTVRKMSSENAS